MTISRTYELPAPSKTRDTYSAWHTGHSIAIDGDMDNDGTIIHYLRLGIIAVDAHEDKDLYLTYDEARRVGLALLAAVEEGETMKEEAL